jgi:hypothetical protein
MTSEISEAQKKWDLMHTFSYAYICQPPREYWEDEEFMMHRDILFGQVHYDVHRTDWKTIYSRYNEYLPIRLAFKDAKEYYQAWTLGQSTAAYEQIKGYAERTDQQRAEIRKPKRIVIEKPKKKK